jgi:nicotinate-nucleotide adenylyltransferase
MVRAVLGGSFDPVHLGHVAMGAEILARGLADRLVVIPAGRSPLKEKCRAPGDDRLNMCRMAFREIAGAGVDDRELRREGPSFTVDTLQELQEENPDDDLVLVLGADNLEGFPAWRDPDRILRLARLVVFARDGVIPTAADLESAGIPAGHADLVPDFDHRVSSTGVRAMLDRGRLPEAMLPGDVAAYIRSGHLYGM